MNFFLILLLCFQDILVSNPVFSQVNPEHHTVRTYHKKNGTTVQRHEQTNSNHTRKDNYSQKGNTNPRTGKKGTKN